MKTLRMLLATLLITVFIMPYSATRAESAETPVNMSIDIVQNSTEVTVGETITASWTYTAALPLMSYSVTVTMYYGDDTFETILTTSDQSVMSFTYTPIQAGNLSLDISFQGADERSYCDFALWTITGDSTLPEIVPMRIDIVQNSTEISVGETATASWTYSAALPLEYYSIELFMFNNDETYETILSTDDRSITAISYTPTQSGQLYLDVSVKGTDGRTLSKKAEWTVNGDSMSSGVVPMTLEIIQDSTDTAVGKVFSASWTYSAALPLKSYFVQIFMYINANEVSKNLLLTSDQSITSFSYTPAQAGELSLFVAVQGADGRTFSKEAIWSISDASASLPGDANNDGATNINDAIAILQHLADNNASINLNNADISGDGKVTSSDVLVILQRAAGWN